MKRFDIHNRMLRGQRGFTLLEFMVAITISLLLSAGVLQLYLTVSRTNTEMARTNLQIENGRFAIQLIENDLQHAGFWNGYIPAFDSRRVTTPPGDVPGFIPDPCLAYNAANWNAAYKEALLGIAVQVYDSANLPCAAILTNVQPNTDVLVVRHAGTCVPGDPNCVADVANALYFQASNCVSGPSADAPAYRLDTVNFNLKKRSCTAGDTAEKRKYISYMYFVRDFAQVAGDGIPMLMRSQFDLSGGVLAFQPAVPLIEGIEGFRVELGIDNLSKTGAAVDYSVGAASDDSNRGDSVPDPQPAPAPYTNQSFIRCTVPTCTVDQLINTVAVKVFVLVRNSQATVGYVDNKTYNLSSVMLADAQANAPALVVAPADAFQRHLYSTMVRLNNISVRRETPP